VTNSKLMAKVLQKVSGGPAPMEVISHILESSESEGNVRCILAGIERLGLIKKIEMRGG